MKDIRGSQPNWLAADWGTSRLRIWGMGTNGDLIGRQFGDSGMSRISKSEFETEFIKLAEPFLSNDTTLDVVCCGMAGSRQGWAEASYVKVPCYPPGIANVVQVKTVDPRINVFVLPGIKQTAPADVMRGEETQIRGFMATNPGFDGVICLPGTHTKWVHVSAGEIISFQTFMTGELFSLLSDASVLRHTVQPDGWDEAAFLQAVERSFSRPSAAAAQLFTLRAEALLNEPYENVARSQLSGILIGIELAAARPYWLGQNLAVLGTHEIANAYCQALKAQGLEVSMAHSEDMTLAGLKHAYAALKGVVKDA
ncbi:2-dehydro-3-deoxygalactonokinase [Rhodobacteraceae bacterium nBUS_24]